MAGIALDRQAVPSSATPAPTVPTHHLANAPLSAAQAALTDNQHPVATARALAALRIATGFIFLWAFADKLFGLGYSTSSAKSVINGGSPTKGFLGSVDVGPLQGLFHSMAGTVLADSLFMLALFAVGLAVTLGVALRLSAIAGSLLVLGMWLAEFPLARFTATGTPSASVNPIVDYHIIYGLALIVFAFTAAGTTWGLGNTWNRIIGTHRWLA